MASNSIYPTIFIEDMKKPFNRAILFPSMMVLSENVIQE